MKFIGSGLLSACIVLGLYAYFFFDVSNNGFVNLGLMDDRRNMLIAAGFMGVIGAILMAASTRQKGN